MDKLIYVTCPYCGGKSFIDMNKEMKSFLSTFYICTCESCEKECYYPKDKLTRDYVERPKDTCVLCGEELKDAFSNLFTLDEIPNKYCPKCGLVYKR